jgi:iron complex outermembrane recepter protein
MTLSTHVVSPATEPCSRRLASAAAIVMFLWSTLFAPQTMAAQALGSFTGVVVDESGGALTGAQVTAFGSDGVVHGRTVTTDAGSFSLTGLAPGRYSLEISKALFETTRTQVDVTAGAGPSPVRVALTIAGLSENVTVAVPKVDERPTGQILTSIDRSIIKDVTGFSIAEVIGYSPGVTVQQGNGPRDVLISVRGSNTRTTFGLRNIQVFEDGFNVTQPDGLARTDLVDPHAYGGIDVARGPSSSLYGNYAIEGAINFHTRRPEDINGIEVGEDLGSFGYHNTYLTYGHKGDAYEVMAFGSGASGDGFTSHNSFKTVTANVLATYTPSSKNRFVFKFIDNEMYPNLSIRLSLNQFNQNPYQVGCDALAAAGCASVSVFANGAAGAKVNLSAEQAGLQRHDRRTIVGARWEHLLNDRTTWRTQLVWDVKDIKQPTGATDAIGVTPSFNLLSDVTQRGSLFGHAAVHFIGLSANFLNTNSQTFNVAPGGDATVGALTATTVGHVSNFGMRAREELKLAPMVTASFGVGLERTELLGRNTGYAYSASAAPTTTRIDALRDMTNVAPEATLVVQPNKTVRVQARAGSAYGTPQASNLFVTPDGVNGNNTQLKSQTNVGLDTGVDITTRFLAVTTRLDRKSVV